MESSLCIDHTETFSKIPRVTNPHAACQFYHRPNSGVTGSRVGKLGSWERIKVAWREGRPTVPA